jgi:hypothetical protein
MAHYAFINDNNIVTQVIVGRDEDDLAEGVTSWEEYYGARHGQTCLRTSYNTVGNQHNAGGTPFRGNYAGIGFKYDEENDVFVAPQPFPSWTLNDSYLWEAPVAYPEDGEAYVWNENQKNWEAVVTDETA